MIQISVQTDRCVGAGQCVLTAPDVFDQDDDGIVTVLGEEPGEELAPAVRLASQVCPSQAITVSPN